MNLELTPNAKAILLLTAPLLTSRKQPKADLLTPQGFKKFSRRLEEMGYRPEALLSSQADLILADCDDVIDRSQIIKLLGRGFLLSQAVEHWQTWSIWVKSWEDQGYPARWKDRLKDRAPAILYGCGDPSILDSGGLAVVGSRQVDQDLIDYTRSVGRLSARANTTLVSGGARGIDQAAMWGALAEHGRVAGVLANRLDQAAMNHENRTHLMGHRLVLVSPFDPAAGFNVGNAMYRNKLIYALADAALVISSDVNRGGTWAGAKEQLTTLKLVPVFVRPHDAGETGLTALQQLGAVPWPEPKDPKAMAEFLSSQPPVPGMNQNTGIGHRKTEKFVQIQLKF